MTPEEVKNELVVKTAMSILGKRSAKSPNNKRDYKAMGKRSAEVRWGKKDTQ